MADKYLWSGAPGIADGSSWTDAYTTMQNAASGAALGDRILVASDHADPNTNAAYTITFNGTADNPTQVICVNRTSGALTTGAVVFRSGTSATISINGSFVSWGVEWGVGAGTNSSAVTFCANGSIRQLQHVWNGVVKAVGSGVNSRVNCGNISASTQNELRFFNTNLLLGSNTGTIRLSGQVDFEWVGGSLLSGATSLDAIFDVTGNAKSGLFHARNVDLSNAATDTDIFKSGIIIPLRASLANIAMPSGWTGSVIADGQLAANVTAVNVGGGNNNYQFAHVGYVGRTVQDTGIYRSGGATDGTTPVSWKITSTASAQWPALPYVGAPVAVWVDSSGSSVTVTFEVLTDGVTLTDQDFGLEYSYLGSSTTSLGTVARTTPADILASAANLATSSETWVSTGLASPVKQKVSFTFTPQKKGFVQAVPILHRASTTVYFDPEPTVT